MTNEPTRISRRVAVTALATALVATALVATTATTPVAAGPDRPELRAAMRAFLDIGVAGMQLRVHDRRGEWVGSAGVRELGGTAKPSVHGRFRIGSNTKTIVATVVLQLVAEGRIGLDSPVHRHLPEFGLDRRITVRMLLNHTSGFEGDIFTDTGVGDDCVEKFLGVLGEATKPRFMRLTAEFYVRGGICTTVVAERQAPGWRPAPPVVLP